MIELKDKAELLAVIGEAVDPLVQRMTKVERKWGAFPIGVTDEEIKKLAWAEKFGKFLRALTRGQVVQCDELQRSWASEAQIKQMTEGTDTAGGYLVPEEFRAEVVRIIPKFGLLRRFARAIPMGSDTLRVPRQTTGVTVSWPGEAKKGTASKPVLGQVQLNAQTAVGLCSYSLEFLQDAGVPVIEYLQTIFAEAFAGEEDLQWLNGSGAPFFGVLQVAGTGSFTPANGGGKSVITGLTIDDLIDTMDVVDKDADEGAIFIFHKKLLSIMRKVKVTSDYALAPASQGAPATIAGVPYYTSNKMPSVTAVSTAFAIYGNPRYTLLGDRQQMTVDVAREGTIGADNLFEQNMQGLRITERISIVTAVPAAYSKLITAAS